MFDPHTVERLVQAALVADSYSLGLHWIFDVDLLDSEPLDPERLHAPLSHWHGNRQAGDLTHYGDQLLHLYQHVRQQNALDVERYRDDWAAFMARYPGHIDRATAATLDNLRHQQCPAGSCARELAVCVRIACPLPVCRDDEDYLQQVEALTRMTHDAAEAIACSRYFARVLLDCLRGSLLQRALRQRLDELPEALARLAEAGLAAADQDTRTTLRRFGIGSEIRHGLPGVLHLLACHDEPTRLLRENALAGGDSSARGMLALMLLVAQQPQQLERIPRHWWPRRRPD